MRERVTPLGALLIIVIGLLVGYTLGVLANSAMADDVTVPTFDTERKINVIWWNTADTLTPKIRMYVIRNAEQQEFLLACETGTGCAMVEMRAR